MDLCLTFSGVMNYTAEVGEFLHDFHVLATHRNRINGGRIQKITECLDLGFDPGDTQSQRIAFSLYH